MNKLIKRAAFMFLLLVSSNLYAQSLLEQGVISYQQSKFTQALDFFRDVLLESENEIERGAAYFWTGKTYLSLGQFEEASDNIEYFLLNFRDHPYVPEATYQKGRLLYLQEEYEKSIQVLYTYIEEYGDPKFLSNSYFWIGESLFSLGQLLESEKIFQFILDTYPSSPKFEASRYRVDVIRQRLREEVQTRLIKMSHEEYLKTLAEFQKRERTYEQAIADYQRQISALSEEDNSEELQQLTTELEEKIAEITSLQSQISSLKGQVSSLEAQVSASSGSTANVTTTNENGILATPESNSKELLLALKKRALDLQYWYLLKLAEQLEAESE
jgi:TolA-binding protein